MSLLARIEEECSAALTMAQKTRAGEVRGYSNPFSTGNQWLDHAHELLRMRARVLGEDIPEHAQATIDKLNDELAEVRKEFSEMFRISMENNRESNNALLSVIRCRDGVPEEPS